MNLHQKLTQVKAIYKKIKGLTEIVQFNCKVASGPGVAPATQKHLPAPGAVQWRIRFMLNVCLRLITRRKIAVTYWGVIESCQKNRRSEPRGRNRMPLDLCKRLIH